ncbi:MAG: hypothetical protein Q9225_002945 [Loekoesia sp. 1 TL-2023]
MDQVIRGGRHGTNGAFSTEGGIVIDLSMTNHLLVGPEKMRMAAKGGCLWKDVDGGPVILPGTDFDGGYGYLIGRHGLVIDNLMRVKIVTVCLEVITASLKEHPDLFCFLRGAGTSFGAVVDDFALKANPDGSFNFGFTIPPHAPGPMLILLDFHTGLGIDNNKIFAP